MTTDNPTTQWLLPPIALQILHYLDGTDDAYGFLQAAPDGSLDDALDALRTLLAMDVELPVWPAPRVSVLDEAYNVSPSVVTRALPLFKHIVVITPDQGPSTICQNTVLPPKTIVTAYVKSKDTDGDMTTVRGVLGNWLPNLVHLRVSCRSDLNLTSAFMSNVSACNGLRTLTCRQAETVDQATLDAALTAVIATWPQVDEIRFRSIKLLRLLDCQSLLAWLALPTARHLALGSIDFRDEPSAELATAMLTSSTLEGIHLFGVPRLIRALLSPSLPSLPRQLRHLELIDDTTHDYKDLFDDDDRAIARPTAFREADVAALAAKLSTALRLEMLNVWLRTCQNATSVVNVLPQLPMLTKLVLKGARLTSFPPLRHLLHLELRTVSFSDAAIKAFAAFLGSSPQLVLLHFGQFYLPRHHADIVFGALPQWLSHRGTACELRLTIINDTCANGFATALAQTRNSHKVKITASVYGLSLAAQKRIIAALASTSLMALIIDGNHSARENAVLEEYGREQRLQIVYHREHPRGDRQIWFHSPCAAAQ